MKTIVRNGKNESLYLVDDAKEVVITNTETTIGNPAELIISDCNATNVTLHSGVTPPSNWIGWKYLFDGAEWTLNPNYVEPRLPQVE